VRDIAVITLADIISAMSTEDVSKHAVALLNRLARGDWFTSRMTACALLHVVYAGVAADDAAARKGVLDHFVTLCGDETPMVRRAVCQRVGYVGSVVLHCWFDCLFDFLFYLIVKSCLSVCVQ
jgi:serine/threonine-protein phosphatase 2A regulatory subunit A